MSGDAPGQVTRVNGPLIEAIGLPTVAIAELLRVGDSGLPAEVIAIRGGTVTAQAYEYTGGLAPGSTAVGTGRPLSAWLGPWLLGGIFDGLLRPLSGREPWLAAPSTTPADAQSWCFRPTVAVGDAVAPGTVVGTMGTGSPVEHRVVAPPGIAGAVTWVSAEGPVLADEPLVRAGDHVVRMGESWPVRTPRPFRARADASRPLLTGQRSIDLIAPVCLGSSAAVPGGFGTGKTVLLQQVAKWCAADVIVYVGCGERGNEMTDVVADLATLVDPRTGGRLADRTVVVANTSNMPVMAREASIYAGMTVAEYYRDMGYDAVVIADSTSRWAEALRELTSRNGELPAEEGFPATLHSALAAFYERAGVVETLGGARGSVTVIGAVSPPSGDMTEPVTSHTQQLVRCLWSLDRELAYARHYPAIAWSASFSRDAERVAAWQAAEDDPGWATRRLRILGLLAQAADLSALAELVGITSLAGTERAVILSARLLQEGLLEQNALNQNDAACTTRKARALADALLAVADRCLHAARAGVDPADLEEVDFGPVLRARTDEGPDDVDGIEPRLGQVLERIIGVQ